MVLEETDLELVERCRTSRDGYRDLFERYKDKVYSVALRYSGDAATAQDITQETFLKLFSSLGSFRGESPFEAWLYRLVVNACFDQKRRTRRLMPLLETLRDMLVAPATTALDEVLRAEASGELRDMVADLPPKQRIVVALRYGQELSYEEIGEVLGCPAGTVASRLNRVHALLERRLTRAAQRRKRG